MTDTCISIPSLHKSIMSSLRPQSSAPFPSSLRGESSSGLPPSSLPDSATPVVASSSSLQRQSSRSSNRSGLVPSPRLGDVMLPITSAIASTSSSNSASKPGSLISTPKMLSRRSSAKENQRPSIFLARKGSRKGKGKEDEETAGGSGFSKSSEAYEGWRSPLSESGSVEV